MKPIETDFVRGKWDKEVNVRDFIQRNYHPYDGDESFLAGPTQNTKDLWAMVLDLQKKEREAGGVLDMDTKVVSTITSHGPGYLDKSKETIVGFQTDKPFKRSLQPYGGIRMAEKACADNGYEVDPEISEFFSVHRKTHNAGCFDAYNQEMRACRTSHIITGLPDAYGRGRIIGDYRRVALYGIDRLIEDKQAQKDSTGRVMTDDVIRLREEISEQITALKLMKEMAASYGCDISNPATNVQEAIQAVYFGYLCAVKEQNGAAMSLGRTSTFLDVYAERDLRNGTFTEEQIQEFVDHFIMKLRCVKFARTPEYNQIFAGDPVWVTESLGGVGVDGRHMVTKMSFRYLHTLENLGSSPEPNLTVLWSTRLPEGWKKYCAKISITTSSIQYENDDLMRVTHGDDYGIACCVSSMVIGKEMQFFGIIHYMHDKYCYERAEMALHDRDVKRYFATGVAGLSIVADSLSAIKYAKVEPIRDEDGIIVDFKTTGDFPKYGNDDDRVDEIAQWAVHTFMTAVRRHHTYRNGIPTTSILTITSNVTYGKATGNTPDGRRKGQPFAPGANPMHGRDTHGAVASLSSVSKLPFNDAQDGISNTFTIIPGALGKEDQVFAGDIELDLNK